MSKVDLLKIQLQTLQFQTDVNSALHCTGAGAGVAAAVDRASIRFHAIIDVARQSEI